MLVVLAGGRAPGRGSRFDCKVREFGVSRGCSVDNLGGDIIAFHLFAINLLS